MRLDSYLAAASPAPPDPGDTRPDRWNAGMCVSSGLDLSLCDVGTTPEHHLLARWTFVDVALLPKACCHRNGVDAARWRSGPHRSRLIGSYRRSVG